MSSRVCAESSHVGIAGQSACWTYLAAGGPADRLPVEEVPHNGIVGVPTALHWRRRSLSGFPLGVRVEEHAGSARLYRELSREAATVGGAVTTAALNAPSCVVTRNGRVTE